MHTCLARCQQRVRPARFAQQLPQFIERTQARHRRRHLPHHRARHRIEDPTRKNDAWSAAMLDRRAAQPLAVPVGHDDEPLAAQRMPSVGHRANIVSARIMP